jgi:predicted acylesterase/phospholipase RssA
MPATDARLPVYQADAFAAPEEQCDIIMKGGITSGVVYPYAILEIARKYRFRSIGGTSAGAIAAVFAAAAEYARTARNDPDGFVRLQDRCARIPAILEDLFQPEPRFRALMRYLLFAQKGSRLRWIFGLAFAFPLTASVGTAAMAALLWTIDGQWPGIALGGVIGLVAALLVRVLLLLLHDLPRRGFGFCPGTTVKGFRTKARNPDGSSIQGLTDWLHEGIQEIAFGSDAATATPLTFGQLIGEGSKAPIIDLRMVTTNLSMGRPHTLPGLGLDIAYDPKEWNTLFPDAVTTWLDKKSEAAPQLEGLKAFPKPEDLPVLVAMRMSLSFPLLFKAIPAYANDRGTLEILRHMNGKAPKVRRARIWFADGGISSNFPIHLFDALLPSRPTFALSLDQLPEGADQAGDRVSIPQSAAQGIGVPAHKITTLGAFAASILSSAKDWQDQALGTMPGQRERIARVYLSKAEGGLNLTMPEQRSETLMRYGQQVGARFANGALNFDEHRWRRALVAYDQLEKTVRSTEQVWTAGFGAWFEGYLPQVQSYKEVSNADRTAILQRFKAFGGLATTFDPVIDDKRRKFPRPGGRLRIGPDI